MQTPREFAFDGQFYTLPQGLLVKPGEKGQASFLKAQFRDCGHLILPDGAADAAKPNPTEPAALERDGHGKDVLVKAFRMLSAAFIPGHCTDFATNGAKLFSAATLPVFQNTPVYLNHGEWWSGPSVEKWVGVAVNARLSDKPVKGVDADFRISTEQDQALYQGAICRGLCFEPPAITCCSVTVYFDARPSHPDMDRYDFWRNLGKNIDGQIVRWIVEEFRRITEVSLVYAGADEYARSLSAHGAQGRKGKSFSHALSASFADSDPAGREYPDDRGPEDEEGEEEKGAELAASRCMDVQCLLFDKEDSRFADGAACKTWCGKQGFKAADPEESSDAKEFRVRQRAQSDFEEGTLKTLQLTSGVRCVMGRLKSDKKTRFHMLDVYRVLYARYLRKMHAAAKASRDETTMANYAAMLADVGEPTEDADTDGEMKTDDASAAKEESATAAQPPLAAPQARTSEKSTMDKATAANALALAAEFHTQAEALKSSAEASFCEKLGTAFEFIDHYAARALPEELGKEYAAASDSAAKLAILKKAGAFTVADLQAAKKTAEDKVQELQVQAGDANALLSYLAQQFGIADKSPKKLQIAALQHFAANAAGQPKPKTEEERRAAAMVKAKDKRIPLAVLKGAESLSIDVLEEFIEQHAGMRPKKPAQGTRFEPSAHPDGAAGAARALQEDSESDEDFVPSKPEEIEVTDELRALWAFAGNQSDEEIQKLEFRRRQEAKRSKRRIVRR